MVPQQKSVAVSSHSPLPASSPIPPSSPPVPTSSPPVTDRRPTRRASTDSDSSIFSHFSLTRESEAGLQAWEQVMLSQRNSGTGPRSSEPDIHTPLPVSCGETAPPQRIRIIDISPTPSPEPVAPAPRAIPHGDATPPCVWVVFRGRTPGLYETLESAKAQTEGFPNAVSFSYTNAAHAGHDLDQFLQYGALPPYGSGPWVVYVGRSTGVFTELDDLKAAVDGFPRSHYVSCSSVQEAIEIYTVFQTLLSTCSAPGQSQPQPQPVEGAPSNVGLAPILSPSSHNHRGRRPFQPFLLDESIYYLPAHESWWVTWAAVYPGVYFGMDKLLAAGPIPGGYCSVDNQTEGFEYFHLLVKSRLVRKLPAPPS